MKVLVTGAAGVLGTSVVSALHARSVPLSGVGRHAAPAGFPGDWSIADVLVPGALDVPLEGVTTIVHAATNAMKPSADLVAVDNLIASARTSACHVVFISIAGIEEAAIGYGYYAAKLTSERRLAASGVAHTIVRITQFHQLIDFIFSSMSIGPVFLQPKWTLQPVDAAFAGECVARLAVEMPQGRAADVAGPETIAIGGLVDPWLAARNKKPLRLPAPAVGPIRALGRLREVEGERGGRTWQQWLAGQTGPGTAYRS